jgi:hypothetical protein
MYYETFAKRYQKFYISDDDGIIKQKNAGLDVMSVGMLTGWIGNHENHSLRSVFTLSEKQTASSGSFLYGLGAFYTSIYSQNETTSRYIKRQHIVYFGPTAGYSHTWIFKHDIFLNLALNIGANLGIGINDPQILFIPQVNPKIIFGHHNSSWSVNAVMGANASLLLWGKGNFDILAPVTMSITFSKRF